MKERMPGDKQLRGIQLTEVLEKRRLDQALNAKEFAICAGVSYSTARHWFHLPGFPVINGVIFWQDFVRWRTNQNDFASKTEKFSQPDGENAATHSNLPARAARILAESR